MWEVYIILFLVFLGIILFYFWLQKIQTIEGFSFLQFQKDSSKRTSSIQSFNGRSL